MAVKAILRCRKCGNEFEDEDAGLGFMLCIELRDDLKPMCLKCKSRDVKVKSIEAYVDPID